MHAVARSADSVVYKRKVTYHYGRGYSERKWRAYGCLSSVGRQIPLDDPGGEYEDTHIRRPVKLAGDYVAYGVTGSSNDPPPGGIDSGYVAVTDLRSGRKRYGCTSAVVYCSDRRRPATDLVLKPSGSAAWIRDRTVFALPVGQRRASTLDDGAGILPTSLRVLATGSVAWTRAGQQQSAPLP